MSKHTWQDWMRCVECQAQDRLCGDCRSRKAVFESTGECVPPLRGPLFEDIRNLVRSGGYACPYHEQVLAHNKIYKGLSFSVDLEPQEGRKTRMSDSSFCLRLDQLPTKEELNNLPAYFTGVTLLVPFQVVSSDLKQLELYRFYCQGLKTKTELLGEGLTLPEGLPESQPLVRPGVDSSLKDRFSRDSET